MTGPDFSRDGFQEDPHRAAAMDVEMPIESKERAKEPKARQREDNPKDPRGRRKVPRARTKEKGKRVTTTKTAIQDSKDTAENGERGGTHEQSVTLERLTQQVAQQ